MLSAPGTKCHHIVVQADADNILSGRKSINSIDSAIVGLVTRAFESSRQFHFFVTRLDRNLFLDHWTAVGLGNAAGDHPAAGKSEVNVIDGLIFSDINS